MMLEVTLSSKYFLLVTALQFMLGHPCSGECPVNVWDCNSHVFRATSDQELFPFLQSAPEAFQPLPAPGDSAEGQQPAQPPQKTKESYNNPGFYDPTYGFSKESIADLITMDKDSYSIEPILIEAVPPVGNVYSNGYQKNFEQFSEEGRSFKNIFGADPANDGSDQTFDHTRAVPYKNPLTFVDALIRQIQQVNTSINHEQSERFHSSPSSADYTHLFRNNFKDFQNLPVNSVNKYEDEPFKSHHFKGKPYGEDFRGIATKLESIAPQYQGFRKDVVPGKSRDSSDLLEQSRALNGYLNRLKTKAEAHLLEETKNSNRAQRGGKRVPLRGGRAIYRRRLPQPEFAFLD